MTEGGNIYELQGWMYSHKDSTGRVTDAFLRRLETFMYRWALHRSHKKPVRFFALVGNARIQNLHVVKLYVST